MKSFELYTIVSVLLYSLAYAVDWSLDQDPAKWNKQARETIESILNLKTNRNIAKNIILFIGDG